MSDNNFEWEKESAETIQKTLELGKRIYDKLNESTKQFAPHENETNYEAVEHFMENLSYSEECALRKYNDYLHQYEQNNAHSNNVATETVALEKTAVGELSDLIQGIHHKGTKLSELLNQYIQEKTIHSSKRLAPKTIAGYEADIERFILFVGDVDSDSLGAIDIKQKYIYRRKALPSQVHRKVKYHKGKEIKKCRASGLSIENKNGKDATKPMYLSIEEILKIAESDSEAEYSAPRTISNEYSTVQTFLQWCSNGGFVGGKLPLVFDAFIDEKGDSTYLEFTDDDLKKLFNNEFYKLGKLFDTPHYHWLPLLALYHGNRISEMAMLNVDNVQKIPINEAGDDIWIFKIENNAEKRQRTKNSQSVRDVPLHKTIIELGFCNYVEYLRDIGEVRLFPQEPLSSTGNWGNKTSGWFNNAVDSRNDSVGYVEFCDIQKHEIINDKRFKKVFHSFRKNWSTAAKRFNVDYEARREITGHSEGKATDVHAKVYESRHDISRLKVEIDKVSFNIDISKIKKWER